MVAPLDGAASPHPRRRRYLQDARQGRGEWRSVAPPATPASCARRVATRGKGCVGGVRACAPPPQAPSPGDFCAGVRGGCWRREERRGGAGRGGEERVTGSIRARKALEGRARAPPLLLSSNRLLPHHSGALAGGRLENEHAIGRARWLHRRRHLGIEPPLARPLLACEHRAGNLPPHREAQRRAERVEDTERLSSAWHTTSPRVVCVNIQSIYLSIQSCV